MIRTKPAPNRTVLPLALSHTGPQLQRLASITYQCTNFRGRCPPDSQDARDSGRAVQMMQQTAAGTWLLRELSRNENLRNSAILIDFTSAVVRREGGTYGSFFPPEVGASRYTAYVDTVPHRAAGRAQPRAPDSPLPRPVSTYGGGDVIIPSYVVERPSMMAETLYHELLHIWYINTFSELGLAHPDAPRWGTEPFTGHRDASLGEIERPFARRLRQFAEQIYRQETAPRPTPAPAAGGAAPMQRKPAGQSHDASTAPQIVHDVLRSPGQPLDAATRAYMEPRFGHDFSQVRVHADANAADSARAVNALAYTVGRDIAFGAGQFALGTAKGRRLIAHELTHVVQQSSRAYDATTVRFLPRCMVQRTMRFDASCDSHPYLKCAIYEAVRDARRVVGAVLSELAPVAAGTVTSGRIVDLLNVHFHVPSPQQVQDIHQRFRTLSVALQSPPAFNCLALDAPECASPDSTGVVGGASTVCGGGVIDICAMFNNLACTARSHIINHEMAHHELCAAGDVYAGMNPGQYMTLSSDQAIENADSYAQFAEMVDRGSPICRECYLPNGARRVEEEVKSPTPTRPQAESTPGTVTKTPKPAVQRKPG